MFNETSYADISESDAMWRHFRVQPVPIVPLFNGQAVARPKLNGIGIHEGVIDGLVFESEPGIGAHYSHPTNFSKDLPTWTTSPPPATPAEYQQMKRAAEALKGTPWTWHTAKCQDIKNAVRYGTPKSPTRDLLILTLIGIWLSSDN